MQRRDAADLRAKVRDHYSSAQSLDKEVARLHRTLFDVYARECRKDSRPSAACKACPLDQICGTDKPPAGDIAINSLLYVSRSRLNDTNRRHALLDIQYQAVVRNNEYGLTGVLLATRNHFAQFLEGPIEGIDSVMKGIMHDRRHHDIVVADTLPFDRRIFPNWRMACFSPSSFVSRRVALLLDRNYGLLSPSETTTLIAFMRSSVANFGVAPPGFEADS